MVVVVSPKHRRKRGWRSIVGGLLFAQVSMVRSFSKSNNNGTMGPAMSLMNSDSDNLDRFQSVCWVGSATESRSAVDQFESSLWESLYDDDDNDGSSHEDLWAAVYRSNNNKPSVIVRDDFFRAMNEATNKSPTDNNDSIVNNNPPSTVSSAASFVKDTMPLLEVPSSKPVAIARLKKTNTQGTYLLDNLRCALKKETQDASCDGGSEFVEALSVAVDTLVLHHLQELLQSDSVVFEGTLRTKATLFSNKLFEERGFQEVDSLSLDMATHVSNYESCLSQYAERSIAPTMAQGTRDRALQIVALLGRLDPSLQTNQEENDDDYDPWANMQIYRS